MSDDVQQFIDETENAEDLGALPWWTPTKKTPAIVGRVLEYRAIDTEYGRMRGEAVELVGQAVVQDGQRDEPRLADKGERVSHSILAERGYHRVTSFRSRPIEVRE